MLIRRAWRNCLAITVQKILSFERLVCGSDLFYPKKKTMSEENVVQPYDNLTRKSVLKASAAAQESEGGHVTKASHIFYIVSKCM